jgi:hypothetical protein
MLGLLGLLGLLPLMYRHPPSASTARHDLRLMMHQPLLTPDPATALLRHPRSADPQRRTAPRLKYFDAASEPAPFASLG